MPAEPLDLFAIRKQQRRIAALMRVQPTLDKLTKKKLNHHPTKVCSKLKCNFCSNILGRNADDLIRLKAEYEIRRDQRRYRRLLERNLSFDKTLFLDVGAMNLRGLDARGYGEKGSYLDGEDGLFPNGMYPSPSDMRGIRNATNDSLRKFWRLPSLRNRPSIHVPSGGNLSLQIDSFGIGDTRNDDTKSRFTSYSRHTSVRFDEADDIESELDFDMSRGSTMWREETATARRQGSSRFSSAITPAFAAKYFREQQISKANLLNSLQDEESLTKQNEGRHVKFNLERNKSQYFVSPEYYSDNDSIESNDSGSYEDNDSPVKHHRERSRQSSWCKCETPSCKSTERCSTCDTVGYHQETCKNFDEENSPLCLDCNRKIKGEAKKKVNIEYRTLRGMKDVVVGTRRMTPPPKTPAKTPTKEQVQREQLWYNRFGMDKDIPADFKLTGFLDSLDQFT